MDTDSELHSPDLPRATALDLDDFVELDSSEEYEIIPYSLFIDVVDTPMPMGLIIVKYDEYISFTYFEPEEDTWKVHSSHGLSESQIHIPVQNTSYFGDSVGFIEDDCELAYKLYQSVQEQLEETYNVTSLEPIERVTTEQGVSIVEPCEDGCSNIEEFEYHTAEGKGDITLILCRSCHNIQYVEFAGKKYTRDKLTIDTVISDADVSVYETDDEDMYFVEGMNTPSLYDAFLASLWWDGFRSLGGIEKYAPDIQRSVVCMKESEPVGFITWQYLKSMDSTPVIQNVYFAESVENSEIQHYYRSWRELTETEEYFVITELTPIPYSPVRLDDEHSIEFLSLNPAVLSAESQL